MNSQNLKYVASVKTLRKNPIIFCTLCKNPLVKPVYCSACGFKCYLCITKNNVACCKGSIGTSSDIPINGIGNLKLILENLQVFCPINTDNENLPCEWTGSRADAIDHCINCIRSRTKCIYGCGSDVNLLSTDHLDDCESYRQWFESVGSSDMVKYDGDTMKKLIVSQQYITARLDKLSKIVEKNKK